jgi:hypothetical protein
VGSVQSFFWLRVREVLHTQNRPEPRLRSRCRTQGQSGAVAIIILHKANKCKITSAVLRNLQVRFRLV